MNFPTASQLSAFQGLIPWLLEDRWKARFQPETLMMRNHFQVISMRIVEKGPELAKFDPTCFLLIQSRAKSSSPSTYQTHLYFFVNYDGATRRTVLAMEAECNCFAGSCCQHAVAACEMLKAIASQPLPASAPRITAAFSNWLSRVKEASKLDTARPRKPAKPSTKFLAYCIESRSSDLYAGAQQSQLHFVLRVGSYSSSGFSIAANIASADPSRMPAYMAPEDMVICAKVHNLRRKRYLWGESNPLEDDHWQDILMPALATGRMFLRDDEPGDKPLYTRLTEGAPLPVEPIWEQLDGGGARPILQLPSPEMLLIPTEPLHYLDTASHTLGPATSHLPASLLKVWDKGPVIPLDSIAAVSQQLAAMIAENSLPLPEEKNTRHLTGLKPVPCLFVTEVPAGVYLKRHLGGLVKFQYPGRPPLLPIAPNAAPRCAWVEGDTRFVLERDSQAEDAFAEELNACGFTPLHQLFRSYELNDKNRHSVVLHSLKDTAADWLGFLESPARAALDAQGWLIETDPKIGLTIHDVRDFFADIQSDPDHAINWFRFDVTGEFDGKRISLIPHLARAIAEDWLQRYADPATIPESLLLPCDRPEDGQIRFPARRFLDMIEQVRHLFHGMPQNDGPLRLDRLSAAAVADSLAIQSSETTLALAALGRNLRDINGLPPAEVPATLLAELRHYQIDGFRWLQFLASHGLHGVLADDMGLGKTLQTLAHLAAEQPKSPQRPSLVVAPTSVVPNWAAEAARFAPALKVLVLHGGDRADHFERIPEVDVVLTSYPLLVRDFDLLSKHHWKVLVLDEAQYIKNPKALTAMSACKLRAGHRLCLSGTPMENHLGELWSLMRFLMPGYLGDEKTFNTFIRKPIERDHSKFAQATLNRRVSPLILRRTKDQVATELPAKTTLIHGIDLNSRQTDLYESVRAAMDQRVRDAITAKGLAKSHIIVLDALLKLRQICCHPQLLKSEAAQRCLDSAKLDYLTKELLPTLLEEGRRILLFSQFTSMLALIEEHLQLEEIPFLKLTGQTKERAALVRTFQAGEVPIFLISLKAGGTGLNLTAADTVIHYDPWWNPAAENQATDRAHRIGQNKPVFVHKLVCRGTIEERILDLQRHKAALVEALLSEDTSKLRIDAETLSHLLSPLATAGDPTT